MACCCSYFDKWAWLFNVALFFRNKRFIYEIEKHVTKNSSVLDVGGGTGLIAKELTGSVKKIAVLDPSKKMLDKITSKKIQKIHGAAQEIQLKSSTIDLIYCIDSFHHFTNGYKKEEIQKTTKKCIQELFRVLKKDGKILLIEFDPSTMKGAFIQFMENKVFKWGSTFYTPKELKKLFKGYNITTKKLTYGCYSALITK